MGGRGRDGESGGCHPPDRLRSGAREAGSLAEPSAQMKAREHRGGIGPGSALHRAPAVLVAVGAAGCRELAEAVALLHAAGAGVSGGGEEQGRGRDHPGKQKAEPGQADPKARTMKRGPHRREESSTSGLCRAWAA
jgi:hypothetical protein